MMVTNSGGARHLADVFLLNRAIYGGADDMVGRYLADYVPSRDPDAVGNRLALNVYDRYDKYLQGFGFKTLSSAELGFAPQNVSASEMIDGLDHNFTYHGGLFRNNFQSLPTGVEVPFTNAGAVALVAVQQTAAGKELHLVFRGTDADLGIDGEAGTGAGQVRYYEQLKGLIDQVYAYAANAANDIREVVVSGHSLGGAIADLFTLYDGARFAALKNVGLSVVSLASAGVAPDALALRPDFDHSLLVADAEGLSLRTPDWYASYDNANDIVRNPERYDFAAHLRADPEQAPVTNAAVATLRDHLHFEGHRLTVETPLLDQYTVSAKLETNFLANHYASYYELIGTELAKAGAAGAEIFGFERVVALNGTSPELAKTPGTNDANGFGLPIDDTFRDEAGTRNTLVLGLNGNDIIATGSGNDFLFGGEGNDRMGGRAGDDWLVGGNGNDLLYGEDGQDRLMGDAGNDLLVGGAGNDSLQGGSGDDRLLGDNGNDIIGGGDGRDLITGGRGADSFVFLDARTTSRDRILDFSAAQGDKVAVDAAFFGLAAGTALDPGRFVSGAGITQGTKAGVGQFLFDTATHTLSWDADGSKPGAAIALASFDNADITAKDIMVFAGDLMA